MRKSYRLVLMLGLFLLVVLVLFISMKVKKTDEIFKVGDNLVIELQHCQLVFKEGTSNEGSIEAYGINAFHDLGEEGFKAKNGVDVITACHVEIKKN